MYFHADNTYLQKYLNLFKSELDMSFCFLSILEELYEK